MKQFRSCCTILHFTSKLIVNNFAKESFSTDWYVYLFHLVFQDVEETTY